jgi:hypothetical protein
VLAGEVTLDRVAGGLEFDLQAEWICGHVCRV